MTHRNELSRRQFHRLTAAALGGVVAGSVAGCGDKPEAETAAGDKPQEIHVCRGLNSCNGKGAGGNNQCAGQGTCATAEHHACHTDNACKGQGGCGESAGKNDCKGKGECAVPLMAGTWKKVREEFEARMKAEGKEFGPAPEES